MIKSNVTDKRSRQEKYKQVIPLPSGGFTNRSAFPDGKITVYPWDSLTDAWLTEASQRATETEQGHLLFKLLEKVCNLNGCPVTDFVLGDVNAVLLTSRSIQTENQVNYTATCPSCGHEEQDDVKIPDELEIVGAKGQDYKGTDKITLPTCLDVVELRPLRIGDVVTIATRTPENKKVVSDHVANLIAPIVTINDTQADRLEELVEWYLALPPKDAAFLESETDRLSPHLNQHLPHTCDRCGKSFDFRLIIDAAFFLTGRLGAARK
jgi:hypothetical protein